MIKANLILHAFCQPSPNRSKVVHLTVRELCSNKSTLQLLLGAYMIFLLALPKRIQRNHQSQRQPGNVQGPHSQTTFKANNWLNSNLNARLNKCNSQSMVKGCGMSPWLVLASPCFRVNVVASCKIVSFLCSLDNLLQKNVIVFFL